MKGKLVYKTKNGKAYCADSIELLKTIKSNSVNLVLTSPPFALRRKKSYGNVSADEYYQWFLPFAKEIRRILKPSGSFVLDIGGSWNEGIPTRSLYHFELLLRLCVEDNLFNLAQEFYWYNPAKMPAPAQWVTIERIRVKDAVNTIWWLSKSENPKADNRRVLHPYKKSMQILLRKGYNQGLRPSGHLVSSKWSKDQGGSIPSNIIIAANTKSTDDYIKACREFGLAVHPARFVDKIPEFFIKFLTKPNELVLDPFAGSNVVGSIAEKLKRNWISVEIIEEYVIGSAFRFNGKGKLVYNKYLGNS
jgi:site-specific DNA-methyltransferase (cytosine-N4-specific)